MPDRVNTAFLRQIFREDTGDRLEMVATLGDRSISLGRDPSCEIAIDINTYGAVSRRHAEIRPIFARKRFEGWEICDLNSANGTFINGKILYGCQRLQHGDRLQLTKDGPKFLFEMLSELSDQPVTRPENNLDRLTSPSNSSAAKREIRSASQSIHQSVINPSVIQRNQRPRSQITNLTLTKLIPIFSTGGEIWNQAYLLPGMVTVFFVVMMFAFLGQPQLFNLTISAYISLAAYYFVYRLCGKNKPWWVILGAALCTAGVLNSPILQAFLWFFYEVLPGTAPRGQVNFFSVLIAMFFGAGLMEELLKAIPIFALWLVGLKLSKKWRSRIGISEPLDGILIGAASAVGFTLTETLGLYVPNIIQSVASQAVGSEIAELTGLQLLIPRVLGSVAGHMAYSGYFGYFIGLSVMKPSLRWQILTIGYLSAALLHALWNTSAIVSFWLLAIVGGISYAFLVAAILKAHSFSSK